MPSQTKIKLLKSTAIVSSCTLLSRGLGFIREMFMAYYFGTTLAKSAFDIAFLIPNLFRRVLGEGAFSAAFIPVYTEAIEKRSKDDADKMASSVLAMLGCVLIVIVAAGIAVISVLQMSSDLGERASAVLPLLKIMLPYAFFICMVAGCIAVLNSVGRFAVPAISPVLLNVIWICVLAFICKQFGDTPEERIYGVAWGVVAAGGIQLLLQAVAMAKNGFKARINFDWKNEEMRKIMVLMGPAAIGMGVFQFNFLIDRLLAMYIAEWAPAALTFSERLIYFPLGIFATALATVLLPTFSQQAAGEEKKELLSTLSSSLKSIVLIMIPASVGVFVLARPLVELVFERGVFTESSTTLTARALWFYSPGLLVFSLHKVFVPAFYALKDTVTPVRVAVKVVLINLALNILFILTWPDGYRHSGLAFATVIASAVNSAMLGYYLNKKVGSPGWRSVFFTAMKAVLCAAIMGAVVFCAQQYGRQYAIAIGFSELLSLAVSIVGGIICGVVVYLPAAFLLCRDDFRHLLKSIKA
ncbi:murein biosynthesis integral membrane protein MurJ [bacterium B17]|nr:murein biosynthesis integral membrane protein MurJ [bacterium B17]